MQSHYSINVAKNKKHFFATAAHSLTTVGAATEAFGELSKRFPKSEGFDVSITYWEGTGTTLTHQFETLQKAAGEQQPSEGAKQHRLARILKRNY